MYVCMDITDTYSVRVCMCVCAVSCRVTGRPVVRYAGRKFHLLVGSAICTVHAACRGDIRRKSVSFSSTLRPSAILLYCQTITSPHHTHTLARLADISQLLIQVLEQQQRCSFFHRIFWSIHFKA